jgi:hypothetical protein
MKAFMSPLSSYADENEKFRQKKKKEKRKNKSEGLSPEWA